MTQEPSTAGYSLKEAKHGIVSSGVIVAGNDGGDALMARARLFLAE